MFCFIFCVFCAFVLFCVLLLLMHIVVSFLFVYKFIDHCHRMETQFQLISIIYNVLVYVHCVYRLYMHTRKKTFVGA